MKRRLASTIGVLEITLPFLLIPVAMTARAQVAPRGTQVLPRRFWLTANGRAKYSHSGKRPLIFGEKRSVFPASLISSGANSDGFTRKNRNNN